MPGQLLEMANNIIESDNLGFNSSYPLGKRTRRSRKIWREQKVNQLGKKQSKPLLKRCERNKIIFKADPTVFLINLWKFLSCNIDVNKTVLEFSPIE